MHCFLKPVLSFGFCLLLMGRLLAQAPFAQVNQTPLLLNSSLAGSKEKKRIGLGWNTLRKETERQNNYFVSYDQVLRKWGSGVGIYYLHQNFQRNQETTPVPRDLTSPYQSNYYTNQAGITIAPKFNVMSRSQPTKIEYTVSPSLVFEFSNIVGYQNERFYSRDYSSTLYSVNYPSGLKINDSTLHGFDRYKTQVNRYRIGLGLQLNSENLVLLYQFKYGITKFNDTQSKTAYNNVTHSSSTNENMGSFTTYGIEQTLTLGLTFPKKKGTLVSFTPMMGLGYFLSLNSPVYYKMGTQVAEAHFEHRLHYRHASANFRIAKVLFGAAYTSYGTSYYGGTLGYQFPWLKLTSTWNVGLGSQRLSYSEITANVTF